MDFFKDVDSFLTWYSEIFHTHIYDIEFRLVDDAAEQRWNLIALWTKEQYEEISHNYKAKHPDPRIERVTLASAVQYPVWFAETFREFALLASRYVVEDMVNGPLHPFGIELSDVPDIFGTKYKNKTWYMRIERRTSELGTPEASNAQA